jgi:hypothetical protein
VALGFTFEFSHNSSVTPISANTLFEELFALLRMPDRNCAAESGYIGVILVGHTKLESNQICDLN